MTSYLVPKCGIWWGAHSSMGWQAFEQMIGREIAIVHDYTGWTNSFPDPNDKLAAAGGRILYMDWEAKNYSNGQPAATWAQIANGSQDAVIKKEALELKAFGKPMMLTFQSEPEGKASLAYGTGANYVAAWRHIHNVFADEGVTNVVWVWDVTGDTADHRSQYPSYYPGDAYVDWIMWDPYNWYNCRTRAETWQTLGDKVSAMYDWLTANSGKPGNGNYLSKPWGLAEYGTVEGPSSASKAQWFESEVTETESQFPRLKALIYFDSDDVASGRSCNWRVDSSSASLAGFKLAGDSSYVTSMP